PRLGHDLVEPTPVGQPGERVGVSGGIEAFAQLAAAGRRRDDGTEVVEERDGLLICGDLWRHGEGREVLAIGEPADSPGDAGDAKEVASGLVSAREDVTGLPVEPRRVGEGGEGVAHLAL